MAGMDLVEVWLKGVARSHSSSKGTEKVYRYRLKRFMEFADTTPEQIYEEYQNCQNERLFRQKYTMLLSAWQSQFDSDVSPSSVIGYLAAAQSFFKYMNLPLGFVPTTRCEILYHNRDIQREEVLAILAAARPRERAFFSFMVQSGLRPDTVSRLQFKDLPELESGKTPMFVRVSKEKTKGKFGAYFSFIGSDALDYLKAYLGTRTKESLTPDSYVFTDASGDGKISIGTSQPTHVFTAIARKLRETGTLNFEKREGGKPSELRMYTLRKYFRNNAIVGSDNVNFFMGHKIGGSDDHYFSRENIEAKRAIYAEKAAPFLRLESTTPTETEKTIEKQAAEIKELRETLAEIQKRFGDMEKHLGEMKKTLE